MKAFDSEVEGIYNGFYLTYPGCQKTSPAGFRRKNQPMKKRVFLVILIVAVAAGLLYTFLTRNQRGNDHFISVSGNIEATEVDVGFKISGRIVNRPFEEGAWVERGTGTGQVG